MYKYSYVKCFDPDCKIVSQIGVEPASIDSGVSCSLSFTDQLSSEKKSLLDQVMTDRGYDYVDTVIGGVENYMITVSPNGSFWKIFIDDSGILATELL